MRNLNEAYLVGTQLIVQLNGRKMIIADDVDLGEACEIMLSLSKDIGQPVMPVRRELAKRREFRRQRR
jgi:hypothetical protein